MPTPNEVVDDRKQHNATVHRTRPVHILSRDGLRQRPEQEEPQRDDDAERRDVNGKAKLAQTPATRR